MIDRQKKSTRPPQMRRFNLEKKPEDGWADKWAGDSIEVRLEPGLLGAIVHQKAHWNNCELAQLIRFNRRPDNYCPDFHLRMSFFHI